ncbi:hypothetical protein Leryth_006539 [Lithospermum erythrorhizon]|nr:hypothetical protein Leryth_006539 [Lithospermum erythrorhizon]
MDESGTKFWDFNVRLIESQLKSFSPCLVKRREISSSDLYVLYRVPGEHAAHAMEMELNASPVLHVPKRIIVVAVFQVFWEVSLIEGHQKMCFNNTMYGVLDR